MRIPRPSIAPPGVPEVQRNNFLRVQIDAIGIGLASAASPFLPVFLTRAGASNFQVGLLTSMPALTGLLLALAVGRFLEGRRHIVPWFSGARFLVVSSYALTGLAIWLVPREHVVTAVLLVWAAATVPQTMVNIAFSVVMNAVAGPDYRYELMSRRWSILGFTTAITVALAGQVLDRLPFPFNYQVVFIALSLGGFISLANSSRIVLPPQEPPPPGPRQPLLQSLRAYWDMVRGERPFVSFLVKRFLFYSGTAFLTPLFPLYYVRVVQASDAWIGIINTTSSLVLLVAYLYWARQSRVRGSRFVLLVTTGILSLQPAWVAITRDVWWIAGLAALAGFLHAGLELVFFDELMKTVPPDRCATFVSLAQGLQYLSTLAAPLLGALLANLIGLGGALVVGGMLRFLAFALFLRGEEGRQESAPAPAA